jgi:DNA-binding NarL/FixJ family response regulator
MAGMTTRLAIVDDHPMVTGGLGAALATVDDLIVVDRGQTFEDAQATLVRDDLDVVLLDVRLENGNGLQALAERGPRIRPAVLVISSFRTSQYIAASARYGAAGFLLKTVPLATLIDAIRAAAAGASVFTQDQLQKGFVQLPPRDREILRLAQDGRSNKEIAAILGVSAKTVESHLTDMYHRFEINGGRIELTHRAEAEGWLDLDPPARPGPEVRTGV